MFLDLAWTFWLDFAFETDRSKENLEFPTHMEVVPLPFELRGGVHLVRHDAGNGLAMNVVNKCIFKRRQSDIVTKYYTQETKW